MKAESAVRKIRKYSLFFVLAVIFVLVFSTSTSPLFKGYGSDSAIFQVIGKSWLEGKIPYKYTFDHKGPYIFLVNAMGYFLAGEKWGVAVVQAIHLFLTLIGIYKIGTVVMNKKYAAVCSVLSLAFLSLSYEGGNLTEEYTLPFLAFSIYFQYKFLLDRDKEAKKEHDWKISILYGIAFMICAFTRLTNALGMCCGILVIFIILIEDKKWKNILQNIAGVLIGMAIVLVPFLVYFFMQNALYDFVMGTFLLNFNMIGTVTNYWWSTSRSIVAWIRIIIAHVCSYGMVLGGIWLMMKKRRNEAAYMIVVGVLMTIYLVTRYAFYHYLIITLPYLPLIVMVLRNVEKNKKILSTSFIALICVMTLYQGMTVYKDFVVVEEKVPEYQELLEIIPEDEKENFIAHNVKADIYLRYNLLPYYTYFHHQDYHASRNLTVKDSIVEQYETGDVKWILFQANENENCIESILNSKYEQVKKVGEYCLYRRK